VSDRGLVITLCGSARFEPHFHLWNEALGLAGHATFGLCAWPSMRGGEREWYTPEQKTTFDRVHLLKIANSDAVLVLNAFAYVGESTLREIDEARRLGKVVYTLEPWCIGEGVDEARRDVRRVAESFGVPPGFASPFDARHGRGEDGLTLCLDPQTLLGPAGMVRSEMVRTVRERSTAVELASAEQRSRR
jgi:hypothetical protein